MRRPLPTAARRRRVHALLVPLALSASAVDAGASGVHSQSTPCPSSNLSNTLSSQSCSDVCAGDTLCVYRTSAPSSCAVDCVPTVPAATTWTIEWLDEQPNGRAAVVVTSAASNDEVPSTVVVHETVTRIDEQIVVPPSIIHFSLTGLRTPLIPFPLSDAMRTSFTALRSLNLTNVNVSEWKTLPTMSNLRNLSLRNVELNWWPLTAPLEKLERLSLDRNYLSDMSANLENLPASLRSLSLRSTEITRLPSSIVNLTSLHDLILDGNDLQDDALPALPTVLETLSLRNCSLHVVPDVVASHPSLVALDLSANSGIRLPLSASGLPPNLTDLYLSACDLRAFPAAAATNHRLERLDLSQNPLEDTEGQLGSILANLVRLSFLDLSHTQRARVPDGINKMTQLTHLSLANNSIVTVDAVALPPSLEHLNVGYNGNPLALTLPSTASATLQSLNVSHCGLSSLAVVQPFTTLETLDASGNALASIPLVLSPTLRFLNLSHNRLAALPDVLFTLKALEHLDLRGNPLAIPSLSTTHAAFLDSLRVLEIDPSAFQASNCTTLTTVSFGYSACVDPPARRERSVTNNDGATRARVNRNLYIIAATIATALVLVTLVSFALRRGRRRDTKTRQLGIDAWPTELASDRDMTDAEWRALQMWSFWDDEDVLRLRIPWDLVRDRQVIGSGQYSVLWLARVGTQPVFLKALQPTAHRHRESDNHDGAVAAVAALIREIQVLRALRHPQIVRLVGVTWMNAPTDVQVAIEDMANGDLRGYLELTQPPAPLSRWRRDGLALRVALEVADALVFLHRCGVAHNDIRSRNIVLDDDCHAKLSGFGRHVFVEPVTSKDDDGEDKYMADAVASAVAATAEGDQLVPPPSVDQTFLLDAGRWMAPEVLRRHLRGRRRSSGRRASAATTAACAASTAADVYAFGVLLLELDAFELPFAHVETDDDVVDEEEEEEEKGAEPRQRHARPFAPMAPGPHDASDARFSSLPSDHNSLLGGAPVDVALAPAPPVTGATMNACEEKCELALLRRLADGRVSMEMELAASCPATVRNVALECLALRPERRPRMRDVRDALLSVARRRSSTGSSNAPTTRTNVDFDSSRAGVAVATQTIEGDDSGSAESSDAFFVMQTPIAA